MRLALVSDLHATLHALDAVLDDIAAVGVDRIVCLGDVVDLGPEPGPTVERLRSRGIPCVRGNHDPLDERPRLPMLAAVEAWTEAQLTAEQRAWLAALPDERVEDLDGLTVLCVHGSPRSATDGILAGTPESDLVAWWGARRFDVLACGHTHLPLLRRVDDRLVVNVGSVGQPFRRSITEGPPRILPWSEYAIVGCDAGRVSVEHRRVPFDVEALYRALRRASFPDPDQWIAHWPR